MEDQIKELKKSDAYLFNDGKPVIKGAKIGEGSDPEPKGITSKEFARMGYKERVKLANENPELYQELTSID